MAANLSLREILQHSLGQHAKTLLTVSEDPSDTTVDILASDFNIISLNGDFKSQISFNPTRTECGVGLTYKQGFDVNWCGFGDWTLWFEASGPITNVRTRMNLCESILNTGGGINTGDIVDSDANIPGTINTPVANMAQAFAQSQWNYGRIDCNCPTSKTRLANLDLIVGLETVQRPECHLESYVGVQVPTGNRVRSRELFEPIVGHNHHFGVMFGSNAGLEIWTDCENDKSLWFEFTLHGLYFVSNNQTRLL